MGRGDLRWRGKTEKTWEKKKVPQRERERERDPQKGDDDQLWGLSSSSYSIFLSFEFRWCDEMQEREKKSRKEESGGYFTVWNTVTYSRVRQDYSPLGIFKRFLSFSKLLKLAVKAWVIFKLVPGVRGGTCVVISGHDDCHLCHNHESDKKMRMRIREKWGFKTWQINWVNL